MALLALTTLSAGAAVQECWAAYDVLALASLALLGRALYEGACAMGALRRALKRGLGDGP